MNLDLKGKNILVTGGSRGIGKAMVKGLLLAGGRVAMQYHQNAAAADEMKNTFGEQLILLKADLSQPDQCNQLLTNATNQLGGLHVLINNAGIALFSPLNKPDEEWLADWEQTLRVNLISASVLCKKAIEIFIPHGGGRIINISSRAAFRGDTSDFWAYAASKGGLVSLTRSIARAFGKENIMAFNIAPGFVRTDMAQDFIDRYGEQKVLDDIALNRLTIPEDLVPMIILLASGSADHATGTTIDFNAGSYVH